MCGREPGMCERKPGMCGRELGDVWKEAWVLGCVEGSLHNLTVARSQ